MKLLDKLKPQAPQYISPLQTEGEVDIPHETVNWKADEFFYNPKKLTWYLQAIPASLAIAAAPWLISGRTDYISSLVIIVGLFGLIIYASRKPEQKNYSISDSEISINQQIFSLDSFARYWVEKFSTHTQITLVGIKRTAMPITFYLTDKDTERRILAILRTRLPQSNPSSNPADWISRKVNF